MKRLLLLLFITSFFQSLSWAQCPNGSNIDSDGDGVLDCIDPCLNEPSSKIGNLSFESDFVGWTIPQNEASFSLNTNLEHVLHGEKSLYVTAPNASSFEGHAIYSEEFILEDGIAYNFKIPVKRIGDEDGEALRWVLIDENGLYRNFNNYYLISSDWSYITFNNFYGNFNGFTSNKFRLRLEFGLSTVDMVVDKIEFYETSQTKDPAYADYDGDGLPDCGNLDLSNHPDYNALVSIYNSLNGENWTNNTNWLDTTKPISTWYGLTETNGRVTKIDLNTNNLSGTIPLEISNLESLEYLDLRQNAITGTIPSGIGTLTNLNWIDLRNNDLTGNIPASITNIENLYVFVVSDNDLSGKIPDFSTQSANRLDFLWVGFNNFQFGDFENEFSTYQTQMGTNFIYAPQKNIGEFQNEVLEIGQTKTLSTNVSGNQNNYTWHRLNKEGSEGGEIGNGSNIDITINSADDYKWNYYYESTSDLVSNLTLYSNFFKFDDLPSNHTDYNALVAFYNSTNGDNWTDNTNWLDITKPLSTWHGINLTNDRVTTIRLGNNNLTGTLPTEIGDFSELNYLKLWSNQLSGNIPAEIGNLSNLIELNLSPNTFTGSIPPEIGNLTNLKMLWLNQNGLSGTIPASFQNLVNLQQLHLVGSAGPPYSNSSYSGDFPDLTALPLYVLDIRRNYFTFTDIADEFATYKANIQFFDYSPQYTIDQPIETIAGIGDDITLTLTEITSTSKSMFKKAALADNAYQWFKNNVALSINANSDTYVINNAQFSDSGVYHCEVTNPDVSGMIIRRLPITLNIGTLNIEENESNQIKIYPNPTKNILNIKLNNVEADKATLFDVTGKQVLNLKLQSELTIIDISNLNTGIYLLQIKSQDKITTKRIVKE